MSTRRGVPDVDLGAGDGSTGGVDHPSRHEERVAFGLGSNDRLPVGDRGRMHAPEWTEQRRRRLALGIVHHADELREAEGPSHQDDLVVAIVALLAECRDQRRAALKLALGQLDLAYKCMAVTNTAHPDPTP